MKRSKRAQTLLVVIGATLIFLTTIVVITARGILDPDQFAKRLARSLGDERVAAYVAGQVTNGIIKARPNLISVRPILESSVRAVVSSQPFRAVVRSSARSAHYSLFESSGQRVVLALPDVSVLVRSALSQASPELAAKLPPGVETALTSESAQRAFTLFIDFWRMGQKLVLACWLLWYLGIALVLAGLWFAPDRRRGLVVAGSALAAVAIGLLAVPPAGRILAYAVTDQPALRGAMTGVWLTYFTNVRWLALIYGGVGLVFASAGTTVLEAVDPLAHGRRFWAGLTAPAAATGLRVARGAVVLAVGGAAIAAPSLTLSSLAVLAGIGLVYIGLRELFRVVLAYVPGAVQEEAAGQGRRLWLVVGGAVAVVALLLGGTAFLALRSEEQAVAAAGAVTACNGSAALCDATVDKVVFPGAHNAMSNAEVPGWMFPHHSHGLRRMLDDGIRMLAIDVHYGVPTAGRVRTDFEREAVSQEKIEQQLGPEATAAAVRIRNQLVGEAEGPSALYFCHGFCELGAYLVGPTLSEIHDFLVANPGEVLMLVVEDYVQPADLAAAFEKAGLAKFAYTGPVQAPWPTLRRLVDLDQRLLVFAESGRPGVTWLRPAFETFQETPYSFKTPEDFSCKPNRGGTAGALFQINHWLETTPAPRPTNAEVVNAYDFLLGRARACQKAREHVPNVIAVDFYEIGDVVRVARTLNGQDSVAAGARGR
jgi:hypothetical protein